MATTKIWDIKGRLDNLINYAANPEKIDGKHYSETQIQALHDVMEYASDDYKTEKRLYVSGVEEIIVTGNINLAIEKSLNTNQLEEEVLKSEWLENNSNMAEALFELEDHDLLQGQISVVGLDNPEYFSRFPSLFNCKWDLIDCALMSIGQYGQREKNGWRYQLGTSSQRNVKAWRTLFHRSANSGFEETKKILTTLLSKKENIDNDFLKEIISKFIEQSEMDSLFDIRYYYIKYPHFRPDSYGKYTWNNYVSKPYELAVMLTETKWSENTYQPFLKLIDDDYLSRDYCGQYIILENVYIECGNDAYIIKDNESEDEVERIRIDQNENGIDTENRIEKFKKLYDSVKVKYSTK